MSAKKNNIGLIAGLVVVIAVAIAGMVYFSKNITSDDTTQTAAGSAQQVAQTAPAANGNEPQQAAEAKPDDAVQAAIQNASIEVKPGNPVVAKVDGQDITRVDVYKYIKTLPENIQQLPAQTVYPLALDQVVNAKIIQARADKAGLDNDEVVTQQLEQAKKQIIRATFVQRVVDDEISESDLKKAYDEYVSKIDPVEERRARHILLDSEEAAKEVIKKIKDGGSFEQLAQENSIGPTATKGGDLGYFAKTDMVPEFADAAFSMKKGAVSDNPVQTQFGYHIIKLEDIRKKSKPSFEEVEPFLKVQLRRDALDGLISNWRKDAKIEQFDINGEPLKEAAAPAPAKEESN